MSHQKEKVGIWGQLNNSNIATAIYLFHNNATHCQLVFVKEPIWYWKDQTPICLSKALYVKALFEYDAILVFNLHWNICAGFHNSWKRSPSWLIPISRWRLTFRFVSKDYRGRICKKGLFLVDDNSGQKFVTKLHNWRFLQGRKIFANKSLLI